MSRRQASHQDPSPNEGTDSVIVAVPRRRLMGEHPSYHQSIPGEEAKRRLKLFGPHCYLTRYSEELKCYVLSVYKKQKPQDTIKHFKIEIKDNGKYQIGGKDEESEEFDELEQLLTYYEHNRIDPALKTIGTACSEEYYEQKEGERDAIEENRRRIEDMRRVAADNCTIQ